MQRLVLPMGTGEVPAMKLLHILRSEPDEMVRRFIRKMSDGDGSKEIPLYEGPVDYDRLVDEIFQNEMVVCWW
jgi:hypothetical protein